MLHNTFCHIPGIGPATEKRLWAAGITSWDRWQDAPPVRLPNSSRMEIRSLLEKSSEALANDPGFFTSRMPSHEQWRIFPQFRHTTAYIDIETTGLGDEAELTTIALYDGESIRYYINGQNLEEFPDDICAYSVLVSYNGKAFDVPFLERYFRISLNQAQIDLRYVLARMGFKGGLKGCEKMLGIDRGELDGVDGYFAVLLWKEYENYRDPKALETLLAYNIEDTVNLERLLVEAYNRNVGQTPFARELSLPRPQLPVSPFQADIACVERIKRRFGL
jgi:uncharacterized protein YprB with RNaseH-like and TPR domain